MARMTIEGITQDICAPGPDSSCDEMFFLGIDPHRCNGCSECVDHCPTGAIYGETGLGHKIAYPEPCLHCGLCLMHCPSTAIYETVSWLDEVRARLADKNTIVVAMPAPSLRYAFADAFGLEGPPLPKMISALRRLGFTHCWDLEFAADVAIWEEGTEFVRRLRNNGDLPLFTSCCPSWQRYAETFYPDLLHNFSSVKSPTAINGRLAKTYAAEKFGYDPKKLYTVAITPCIAKKYEILRPELEHDNMRDVDAALTSREFIHLVKQSGIDVAALPHGERDSLLGESSGGGTIFGVTGGVAESLLRFAWQALTGEKPEAWEISQLRGMGPIRECKIAVGDVDIKVAAVHGAKHFSRICDAVRAGKSSWQLIEFMACPGGCVCGGGQQLMVKRR